jgi:hypothetical protein
LKTGYRAQEIDNPVFVRPADNLADTLYKRTALHSLLELMRMAKHELRATQRIIRVHPQTTRKGGMSNDGRESA